MVWASIRINALSILRRRRVLCVVGRSFSFIAYGSGPFQHKSTILILFGGRFVFHVFLTLCSLTNSTIFSPKEYERERKREKIPQTQYE